MSDDQKSRPPGPRTRGGGRGRRLLVVRRAGASASVSDTAEDVIKTIRGGARGYAYQEVAKELFISVKTVETHMSNVLCKLQLSSRHALTRWASDRRQL